MRKSRYTDEQIIGFNEQAAQAVFTERSDLHRLGYRGVSPCTRT